MYSNPKFSSEYLHLSSDLKCPEDLRSQLQTAIKERDRVKLEKVIDECEVANYPELGDHLGQARDVLEEMGEGRGG